MKSLASSAKINKTMVKIFTSLHLLTISEVEEYLRSNPYILSGYRSSINGFSCLKSIFFLHNETVNIWSHLLAFMFFFCYLIVDIAEFATNQKATSFLDQLVLCSVLICYLVSMLMSVTYHTFSCHSEQMSEMCLALDYFGIMLTLIGS